MIMIRVPDLISLSLMYLIIQISALMMSICLRSFHRVVINCSGSLEIFYHE